MFVFDPIITPRARAVAETGVDYIAVGELTHSARALDIGLDVIDAVGHAGSD